MTTPLLVGTYTQPILHGTGEIVPGKGDGIYALEMDQAGQFGDLRVVARTPNPSFLCATPQHIYAVNELKEFDGAAQGSVSVFTHDGQQLCVRPTGGTDPCHVVLSHDGRLCVVANFMSGSFIAYQVNGSGTLAEEGQFFGFEGHSVDPQMQTGPHEHGATFDPADRFVYVPDLGLDRIHIYTYDRARMALTHRGDFELSPGTGPRYCEFHPVSGLLYGINQMTNSVDVMRSDDDGDLTLLSSVSTLPGDYSGPSMTGTLRIAPDGRHLYASNRVHDSIAVFAVSADGSLAQQQIVPCGGRTPRDFTIDPMGQFVIVANQDSDNLVSFAVAPDGSIEPRDSIRIPTPTCVVCRP